MGTQVVHVQLEKVLGLLVVTGDVGLTFMIIRRGRTDLRAGLRPATEAGASSNPKDSALISALIPMFRNASQTPVDACVLSEEGS